MVDEWADLLRSILYGQWAVEEGTEHPAFVYTMKYTVAGLKSIHEQAPDAWWNMVDSMVATGQHVKQTDSRAITTCKVDATTGPAPDSLNFTITFATAGPRQDGRV